MNKLIFFLEKFANAKLDWAKMQRHQYLPMPIMRFARCYYQIDPETARLINEIATLFTWGEDKKILLPTIGGTLSLSELLSFKSHEYRLIHITGLSNLSRFLKTASPSDFFKNNFESLQVYFSVGYKLINHNCFILKAHSSISKLEIKLFAALTMLVTKIFGQLPSFTIMQNNVEKPFCSIFTAEAKELLKEQSGKLNDLAKAVDSLKMDCASKLDFVIELGKTKEELKTMRNLVLSLEKQMEQLSEVQGERNFAKDGVLGENSADKKRKQLTLEFFAHKKSKVSEDSEKKTEEETSSKQTQDTSSAEPSTGF